MPTAIAEKLCRMVFLPDATTCPDAARQIREALLTGALKKRQLEILREDSIADSVNVEDSEITQKGKRLTVKVANCWSIKTGEPYKMTLTLEEWANFGKPYLKDTNHKPGSVLLLTLPARGLWQQR